LHAAAERTKTPAAAQLPALILMEADLGRENVELMLHNSGTSGLLQLTVVAQRIDMYYVTDR
jgi:hypothetical protein